MMIVAPKDLQRLNCGFIGWQLQTTELLVKNTVSTSITVHLLVSLLAPTNHLCHPFYQPAACRPQISLSGTRSPPQSPYISLSTSSSTSWSTLFRPSMLLTDHHHLHYTISLHTSRFVRFAVTQSRDMDNIHDRRKKINVLYQRVSFQFCASDDIPQQIGCTPTV